MFVVFPLVGLFHLTGGNLRTGWLWFIPALLLSWLLGRLVDRFLSRPSDRWLRRRLGVDIRTTRAPWSAPTGPTNVVARSRSDAR